MATKVLSRREDQATDVHFDATFTFKNSTYRAKLELGATPALASIPCEKCAKSTRDFMREIGVDIPADDALVNIGDILANLPTDHTRSTPDPEYVFVISSATALEIEDVGEMIAVTHSAKLASEIDAHVSKRLVGHLTCNCCCFIGEHLSSLLDSK